MTSPRCFRKTIVFDVIWPLLVPARIRPQGEEKNGQEKLRTSTQIKRTYRFVKQDCFHRTVSLTPYIFYTALRGPSGIESLMAVEYSTISTQSDGLIGEFYFCGDLLSSS